MRLNLRDSVAAVTPSGEVMIVLRRRPKNVKVYVRGALMASLGRRSGLLTDSLRAVADRIGDDLPTEAGEIRAFAATIEEMEEAA